MKLVRGRCLPSPLLVLGVLLAITLGFSPMALGKEQTTEEASTTQASETQASTTQASETQADDESTLEYGTVDELVGKRGGMLAGAAFDSALMGNYDGFTQDDFSYYNSYAEVIGALKAHKIDFMVTDQPVAQLAINRNDGIGIVPEYFVEDHYGFVLKKGSPLTPQFNELLAKYWDDGTIDQLIEKWTNADDSAKTMPAQDWETPNGTIRVAAAGDSEPMAYLVGNESYGMCIELLYLMASDLGYGLEFHSTNSGSLIAEVQSEKADVAATSFSITPERKQMVDMTDPFYNGGITAVVRATSSGAADGESKDFLSSIAASFERTFITEDRWQLILSGLGVTMLISVVSGAAGLALGFLFVLLRRKKEGGLADKVIHVLESLLGGLPVVVVLMLFYYIIFGSIDISGIIVAILAFTLIFGASCGTIMWNSIRAIDVGQTEAGRALGFSDRDTFFLVVLPQAARQFAPLLLGQFVSLIKDTSIVGYIAVQDLTRVGDLIRARTMEAFFPIIAIAIIYFALCRLMAWLLGKPIKKLEPKDGPRTIKGVKLQ